MTTTDPKRDLVLPGCRIRLPFWTGLLALFQLGAALYAFQPPPGIEGKVSLPLPLQAIMAGLWAGLFALATVLLIQGRKYSRQFAIAAVVFFACYYIIRWIAFTRADYDRERLPVLIFGTFCAVIILVASYYDLKRAQPPETEKTPDDFEP